MINRNDPCPCGSGIKFKKCHMGREEDLVLDQMETLPEGAAEKITALPEVNYGRCDEVVNGLNIEKLSGSPVGVKFVDLKAYLNLGFSKQRPHMDFRRHSAGQMINPMKTLAADPDNIYVAVSTAVSDSTLVHCLAHVMDYLAGSKLNPGLARALAMELEMAAEMLEHPSEFGQWLVFLANEFNVALDAEDTIVSYLYDNGMLIPGETLASNDHAQIEKLIKRTFDFTRANRTEIDDLIKNRDGYMASQAPKSEP